MSEAAVDAARQLRAIKWMIGGALAALAIAGVVVVMALVVLPSQQAEQREGAKLRRCAEAVAAAPLNAPLPKCVK